mgnify:CR=1 FL=1
MVRLSIEILFNGKDLKYLERADLTDEEKLQTQAMASDAEAALLSLRESIEEEGGSVIVDFKGPAMFQIETNDLSDELKQKVHDALRPGGPRR